MESFPKESKKEKIKIGLICGGVDGEREVSLMSALSVWKNSDKNKFKIILLVLTEKRKWLIKKEAEKYLKDFSENKLKTKYREGDFFDFLQKEKIDIFFPLIHGEFGEDGKLQSILEFFEKKISFFKFFRFRLVYG